MTKRHNTQTGGRPATTGVIHGQYALSVGKPNMPHPEGWKWVLLTDVARLETGHTPSRKHPEYWEGNIPWIGIKDATENHGRIIEDTYQHTNELGIENSSARILPTHTVCLSRTASVGYVVVMGRPMATSQDFVNWVCSEALDYRFLKFVLLAERNSFLRFASGTTHQTIYFPEVKAFHICLPPMEEQQAIAETLSSLEEKIELNRRMNETLEAMARAIFKSWFVDFDPVHAKARGEQPVGMDEETATLFPDSFEESELGLIPSGWKANQLANFITIRKGLSYKGSGLTEEDNGFPMLNLGCFGGYGELKAENLKYYLGDYKERHLVRNGDVVIANTDMTQNRVILGSPAIVPTYRGYNTFLFTHHVYAAEFKNINWRFFVYYTLLQPAFRERAIGFATGTTVLALPQESLLGLIVAEPSIQIIERFNILINDLSQKIQGNITESLTLTEIKDTLLPKLISGELQVEVDTGQVIT